MMRNKTNSLLISMFGLAVTVFSATLLVKVLHSPDRYRDAKLLHDVVLFSLWQYFFAGMLAAGAVTFLAGMFFYKKNKAGDFPEQLPVKWSGSDLFLASFLVLFLELAFIRWIPSYTRMLSYFSNFVLLSCFLGMGVGCILAPKKINFINVVPAAIIMLTSFTLLMFVLNYGNIAGNYIWGGAAKGSEVFMGNNYTSALRRIPIEFNLTVIFVLSAVIFAGLGQVLGQAMETMPPLRAYSINIAGSLLGILTLTAVAFFSIPAPIWFLIAFVILIRFLRRPQFEGRNFNIALLCSALFLISLFSSQIGTSPDATYRVFWSPYYKISIEDEWPKYKVISVNEVGHQVIWPETDPRMIQISTPFLLYKNTHGAPPKDVLIIGSGTGNDVNMALKIGARSVDAVEIDSTILSLGRNDNPFKPYSNPRVTAHTTDGRAYLRNTDKTYDFVSFSVLDSLTLFSTYSSLHLESYLFTKQSFEDVKKRLNPDGVFVFYNYCSVSWIILRTQRMMEEVFGKPVLLITIPDRKIIAANSTAQSVLAIFIAGDTAPILEQFQAHGGRFTLINHNIEDNIAANGFTIPPTGSDTTTTVAVTKTVPDPGFILPTDDWPFYYKQYKGLASQDLHGLLVIFICSLAFIFFAARGEILKFSSHFFFLGAGFMLLEVVSITRLALLYGTTWIVNSVVFFSILVMAFLANLFVLKLRPPKPIFTYPLLIAAIALSYLVPLDIFMGYPPIVKFLATSAITFLPIVFSGLIFSTSFSGSKNPAAHFGSNLLGIIIGGMAVYIASRTGYRNLLIIVMVIYALSWITFPKLRKA